MIWPAFKNLQKQIVRPYSIANAIGILPHKQYGGVSKAYPNASERIPRIAAPNRETAPMIKNAVKANIRQPITKRNKSAGILHKRLVIVTTD
jgi:hypothetical protein